MIKQTLYARSKPVVRFISYYSFSIFFCLAFVSHSWNGKSKKETQCSQMKWNLSTSQIKRWNVNTRHKSFSYFFLFHFEFCYFCFSSFFFFENKEEANVRLPLFVCSIFENRCSGNCVVYAVFFLFISFIFVLTIKHKHLKTRDMWENLFQVIVSSFLFYSFSFSFFSFLNIKMVYTPYRTAHPLESNSKYKCFYLFLCFPMMPFSFAPTNFRFSSFFFEIRRKTMSVRFFSFDYYPIWKPFVVRETIHLSYDFLFSFYFIYVWMYRTLNHLMTAIFVCVCYYMIQSDFSWIIFTFGDNQQ